VGSRTECAKMAKILDKILERLDEAEALYGENRTYAALGKVGGAFTSLALAYSKGYISKDEWKELSGLLYGVRASVLEEKPFKDFLNILDKTRKALFEKMIEKVSKCLTDD